MILTNCASCAAPLAQVAKQCSRCKTRYCSPTCQVNHWRAGHKDECKRIKRGGGAEQYNADKKYKEAVAVAVEACAEDTKGQTCYICTQALHWKTKEGLVRMCACRGTAGFVHVSCLAEQAKILVAEGEENNLNDKMDERWGRWYSCSQCEQEYHGVVQCALGWACWKTYVGRPEKDVPRIMAMSVLGNGLSAAEHHEEALSVREIELSTCRRLGAPEESILNTQNNLANTYDRLGRHEEALRIQMGVYTRYVKILGTCQQPTLIAALNLSDGLIKNGNCTAATSFLRERMPEARRAFPQNHEMTLRFRDNYALSLFKNSEASRDDLVAAVAEYEDLDRVARRVLGPDYDVTREFQGNMEAARAKLEAYVEEPAA